MMSAGARAGDQLAGHGGVVHLPAVLRELAPAMLHRGMALRTRYVVCSSKCGMLLRQMKYSFAYPTTLYAG